MSDRALPGASAYAHAILTPENHLYDPNLRRADPELIGTGSMKGCARSWKGAYAVVFHLSSRQDEWAVRCFLEDIPEVERRYSAINEFFAKVKEKMFVDTKLIPDGIKIESQTYPIIKMEWVKGYPLNDYINKCIELKRDFSWLADAFRDLCKKMHDYGVAHGDLQNKNIMAVDEALTQELNRNTSKICSSNRSPYLVLVDYDSFYLPELKGLSSGIKGVGDFCHPMRQAEYNENIDNFPSIVIYLGLKTAICAPDLWKKCNVDDERMILGEDDFIDPENSPILKEFAQIPSFEKSLISNFKNVCRYGSIEKVPTLERFITERLPESVDPFSDFLKQLRSPSFKMVTLGAGQRVGFSCVLVKFAYRYFLFDCGGPAGGDEIPSYRSLIPQLAKLPISAVFISHAHRDHVGEIVQWHKALSPKTPFFITEPTRTLLRMVLHDQIKIADQKRKAHPFEEADITLVEKSLKIVPAGEPSNPKPQNLRDYIECEDIEFEMRNAGHIIGAAYIILRDRRNGAGDVENDGALVYTGDFNTIDCTTTSAPELPKPEPHCWVITEATYGAEKLWGYRPNPDLDRVFAEAERKYKEDSGQAINLSIAPTQEIVTQLVDQLRRLLNDLPISIQTLKAYVEHRYSGEWMRLIIDTLVTGGEKDLLKKSNLERQYELRQLVKEIRRAIDRNATVLIPVFAIGRAQEIAYTIEDAIKKGEGQEDGLPNIRAYYLSSGMAWKIGQQEEQEDGCLHTYLPKYTRETARYSLSHIERFPGEYAQDKQNEILDNPPCVIMATPGMLHDGTSYSLARQIGSRSNAEIIFVAFLEEESPGRKILDLERDQEIFLGKGRVLPVSCKKSRFSISAHANSEQIVSFVESFEPEQVVVMHGDWKCTAALVEKLNRSGMGKRKGNEAGTLLAQAPRNFDVILRNGALLSKGRLRAMLEPTEYKLQYRGKEDMWKVVADIESNIHEKFESSIVAFDVDKTSTLDEVLIRLAAKDIHGKPVVRTCLQRLLETKGFVKPVSKAEEISSRIVKRWDAISEEFGKFELVCPIQPMNDNGSPVKFDGLGITFDEASFKDDQETALAVDFALAQHLQKCCLKVNGLDDLPVAFLQGWAAWVCKHKWGHDLTRLKSGERPEWASQARQNGLRAYEVIESRAGEEAVQQAALNEGVEGWIARFFNALPTHKTKDFSVHFRYKSWDRAVALKLSVETLKEELSAGYWTYIDNRSPKHDPTLCLLTRHYWLRCDKSNDDVLDISETNSENLDRLAGIEYLIKPQSILVYKPLTVERQEAGRLEECQERLDKLFDEAEAFIKSGRYAKEKTTFDDAMKQAKALGESSVIDVLYRFGRINGEQKRYPEAEEYFKEWLSTAEQLGNKESEANALGWLVNGAFHQEHYDEAKEYGQRYLKVAEQLGDRKREAASLSWLVRVGYVQKHYVEVEGYGKRWFAIAEQLNEKEGMTNALWNLTRVAYGQEHYDEAEGYGKRWLILAIQMNDEVSEANAVSWLTSIAIDQEHYDEAEGYGKRRLSIAERLNDEKGKAVALGRLTQIAYGQEHYDEAEGYGKIWLNIGEKLDDKKQAMNALWRLGQIATDHEHYGEGKDYFKRWLTVAEQLNDEKWKALAFKCLARVANKQKHYEEAEGYHKRTLSIDEQLGNKKDAMGVLWNLTQITIKQKRYSDAKRYCEKWHDVAEESGNEKEKSDSLYWLGRIATKQEHYEEAKEYLRKALEIDRKIGDNDDLATVLDQLSHVAEALEHYTEAETYSQSALDVLSRLGDHDDETKDVQDDLKRIRNKIASSIAAAQPLLPTAGTTR